MRTVMVVVVLVPTDWAELNRVTVSILVYVVIVDLDRLLFLRLKMNM